jgi:hypothetical protein
LWERSQAVKLVQEFKVQAFNDRRALLNEAVAVSGSYFSMRAAGQCVSGLNGQIEKHPYMLLFRAA